MLVPRRPKKAQQFPDTHLLEFTWHSTGQAVPYSDKYRAYSVQVILLLVLRVLTTQGDNKTCFYTENFGEFGILDNFGEILKKHLLSHKNKATISLTKVQPKK